MNVNYWIAGAAMALGMGAGSAHAVTTLTFFLTKDGCSSACNPSAADKVTVVQEAAGELGVTVSLGGGDQFHDTDDGNHHALVFDLSGSPTIKISDLALPFVGAGPLVSGDYTEAAGGVSDSPFSTFEYVINYPHHSGGPAGITSFSFDILGSGLTLNSFVHNGDNVYFASDVLANNGNTGNVGSGAGVPTPEPATWAMMLMGFFGLGATLRGRRRTLAA